MFSYFCLYSFIGFLMESTYISLFKKKWIESGLLDGPYIPLYGVGACLLISFSSILSKSYLTSFIFGSILMTILEYCTSIYIEKVFHKKCWDYHHHHFHLHGRICLFYTVLWGILSVILIHFIIPALPFEPTILTELLSLIIICIILKDTIKQKRIVN